MYSGKSTLANYLHNNCDFYLMNYTDKLKSLGVEALNTAGINITLADIVKDKRHYRPFLQEFGTAIGFDEGYGVDLCIEEWTEAGEPEHIVFDNVRFQSQFSRLVPFGFVLAKLHVSPEEQTRRARSKGLEAAEIRKLMEHQAEKGVVPDIWINAERPVEQIAAVLTRMAGIPSKVDVPFETFVNADRRCPVPSVTVCSAGSYQVGEKKQRGEEDEALSDKRDVRRAATGRLTAPTQLSAVRRHRDDGA
jgi:hypothetical protein